MSIHNWRMKMDFGKDKIISHGFSSVNMRNMKKIYTLKKNSSLCKEFIFQLFMRARYWRADIIQKTCFCDFLLHVGGKMARNRAHDYESRADGFFRKNRCDLHQKRMQNL